MSQPSARSVFAIPAARRPCVRRGPFAAHVARCQITTMTTLVTSSRNRRRDRPALGTRSTATGDLQRVADRQRGHVMSCHRAFQTARVAGCWICEARSDDPRLGVRACGLDTCSHCTSDGLAKIGRRVSHRQPTSAIAMTSRDSLGERKLTPKWPNVIRAGLAEIDAGHARPESSTDELRK